MVELADMRILGVRNFIGGGNMLRRVINFVFGIVSTLYVLGCSALISAKLILWHMPKYLVAIVMIGTASAVLYVTWSALFEDL